MLRKTVTQEAVANCIEHAFPDGEGGHVRIRLSRLGKAWGQFAVIDDGAGMSEETLSEAGRLWTRYQLADETGAAVYDGVESALGELRNLPHGIVSMNSKDNIERALANEGLLDHFELVIGYEEVSATRQKPAPDGLLMCLDRLTGMAPGHVVYVGDHQIDIECARNANEALAADGHDIRVFAIGAAYGIGAEFGAWPDEPDYTVQRPDDIVSIVRR